MTTFVQQQMDTAYNRHARRSHTNLHYISLAPLTSRFPICDNDDVPLFCSPGLNSVHSHIEGKSAPATPSILSRDSSTPPNLRQRALSKSKSAAQLSHAKSLEQVHNAYEWLHHAGAAIASEARESKGQSWLVNRASSTNLTDNERNEELLFADDEYSPLSTRNSRAGSRIASARTSRRGSRVGSKNELLTPIASPKGFEGQGLKSAAPLKNEFTAEPDFINKEEETVSDTLDDAEMQRLTRQRGFGLGGWFDTLIEWSVFSVTKDEEDSEEEASEDRPQGKQGIWATENQAERDKASKLYTREASSTGRPVDAKDDEGGWQDAAWLLSVVTRVLI